jgi:hypothetical protein
MNILVPHRSYIRLILVVRQMVVISILFRLTLSIDAAYVHITYTLVQYLYKL